MLVLDSFSALRLLLLKFTLQLPQPEYDLSLTHTYGMAMFRMGLSCRYVVYIDYISVMRIVFSAYLVSGTPFQGYRVAAE